MSAKKTVLVTGATGFIGANLAHRLVEEGHDVHLLVRKNTSHFPWRIADIYDQVRMQFYTPHDIESIDRIFAIANPEWVFHLAAHGAYSWQIDKQQILESNYVLTAQLLDAAVAHGVKSFVNTGTSSEYGLKDHAPKEDEPLEPLSYYAATKAGATTLCRFTARAHDINIPTLRLYSVFGPYEQPNRLMPNLIACGFTGNWPHLVDENCAHDFVYVEDAVNAYLLAAQRTGGDPGAVFNVGTGIQTSLKEVATLAKDLMGIESAPTFSSMPNRTWDNDVWVCDHTKVETELNWRPQFSFSDGFKKMIRWYRDSPHLHSMYKEPLSAD